MPPTPITVIGGQPAASMTPDAKGLFPLYSDRDYLRFLTLGNPNLIVAPPQLVTANGMAFRRRAQGVITRTVQNNGIVPIFWTCSDDIPGAYDANTPFHGIIPPGSAADDGYGAVLDVSRYVNPIILWVRSGTMRASLFAAYDKSVMYNMNTDQSPGAYIFAT